MGWLKKQGTKWVSWFGRQIPDDEVLEAIHKSQDKPLGWHAYPEAQLKAAMEVGGLLVQTHKLKDVVGHDDIAPGRKLDPGPAFPMMNFRGRLMGRAEEQPVVHEVTATLNVRSGPGTGNPTVPGSPLPIGTQVEILAKQAEWRKVDVLQPVNGQMDIQGWVHQRYLQRIG